MIKVEGLGKKYLIGHQTERVSMKAEAPAILHRALQDVVETGISRRVPPASTAGKGKTLGDLVSPLVEEVDWECLKGSFSTATFGFGGSISSSGDFRKAGGGRSNRLAGSGYPPVSCYELALAHRRGRWQLPCGPVDWFTAALQPAGIELLPITPVIASRAVALSDVHRNPFDRLIIATALEHGARFASVDGQFRHYPELSNVLMEL